MRKHHVQFRFWRPVNSYKAKDHQILGCQQVFKYKTDKHDCLQKCKVRLVVCRNQQKHYDLLTKTTTLVITFLHVLLALTAKFDLETMQFDAGNTFVYTGLDEIVFMHMPLRYRKNAKVLCLNKALYGLRRFPLLWQ